MFLYLFQNFVLQLQAVWWAVAGCPVPISKPSGPQLQDEVLE
ncbi:hypothetical protein [Bacteroides cellulosilyticus]|nr:hypothetical protein [Bacteroides cellulosilyticus]